MERSTAGRRVGAAGQRPMPPVAAARLSGNAQATIEYLQHTSGNQAVQRLILHGHYQARTPSVTSIKNELETQETIDTLAQEIGQDVDTFSGSKPIAHPPTANYLIAHGLGGQVLDYDATQLAANLRTRGLRSGDVLKLITCHAGAGGGVANDLLAAIGALGIGGVHIHAPVHYINWNSEGPLLVTDYASTNADVKQAEKIWTNAEDKGIAEYGKSLKTGIAALIPAAVQAGRALAVRHKLVELVAAESEPEFTAHSNALDEVQGTNLARDASVLQKIVQTLEKATVEPGATDAERSSFRARREQATTTFRQGLEALLTVVQDNPQQGAQVIGTATQALRSRLAVAWPKYSRKYFGALRKLMHDDRQWRVAITTAIANQQPPILSSAAVAASTEQVAPEQAEVQPEQDDLLPDDFQQQIEAIIAGLMGPDDSSSAAPIQTPPPQPQQTQQQLVAELNNFDEFNLLLAQLSGTASSSSPTSPSDH